MIKTLLILSLLGTIFVSAELAKLSTIKTHLQQKAKADQDWANLGRYNASDAILSKLPAGTNQVIFMGDSITDGWNLNNWFPGKPYVNRGISGQTTPQMLVRFRPDVINLQPNATLILAGTNDIAGNTGFEAPETIQGNLASMAELARSHNAKVIIASILPVCGAVVGSRPPATILAMNAWIKNYCQQTGALYLDYFSAMVGSDGLLRQDLTGDCLHPNAAGYNIMGPLAQAAINNALGTQKKSFRY